MVEASKFRINSCLIVLKVNWVAGENRENFEGKRAPKT